MKYGLARVSTRTQARDGTSLESQAEQLKLSGAEIIIEETYSGAKEDRKVFNDLVARLQAGDTLIVTKLDRFARTASKGNEIIDILLSKGVSVHILNIGLLDSSTIGKLIRQVLFAFAEFERDCIIERTQAGKMAARQKKGFRDGRPRKYKPKQLDHAISLLKDNTLGEVEKLTGISVSTLKRELARRKQALLEK